MKQLFFAAVVSVLSTSCYAQWTSAGNNINFTTGIVSVGTTKGPTGYKFAVGGSMIAEEVVIKLQSAWPDYVFESDYKRLTLSELEKFVLRYKHLSGDAGAQLGSKLEFLEGGNEIGKSNI